MYTWPYADINAADPVQDHKDRKLYFYRQYMTDLTERNTKVGAVYPGFKGTVRRHSLWISVRAKRTDSRTKRTNWNKAYYDQGYTNGETFFEIPDLDGETLEDMIDMALEYQDNVSTINIYRNKPKSCILRTFLVRHQNVTQCHLFNIKVIKNSIFRLKWSN